MLWACHPSVCNNGGFWSHSSTTIGNGHMTWLGYLPAEANSYRSILWWVRDSVVFYTLGQSMACMLCYLSIWWVFLLSFKIWLLYISVNDNVTEVPLCDCVSFLLRVNMHREIMCHISLLCSCLSDVPTCDDVSLWLWFGLWVSLYVICHCWSSDFCSILTDVWEFK